MNPDHPASFWHHYPGCFVRNWEDPIIGVLAFLPGIFPQPVGHFLGNKFNLLFFSALRSSNDQFAILNVAQSQLQHFTDSHPAAGHQFTYLSVADLDSSEPDLIHGFLFEICPTDVMVTGGWNNFRSIGKSQGFCKFRSRLFFRKLKKDDRWENRTRLVWAIQPSVTILKKIAEPFLMTIRLTLLLRNQRKICWYSTCRRGRYYFSNWLHGNRSKFLQLVRFSWFTSFWFWVWNL